MRTILLVMFAIVGIKAIVIGSEFNFYYWLKYGKCYGQWYKERPGFLDRS